MLHLGDQPVDQTGVLTWLAINLTGGTATPGDGLLEITLVSGYPDKAHLSLTGIRNHALDYVT